MAKPRAHAMSSSPSSLEKSLHPLVDTHPKNVIDATCSASLWSLLIASQLLGLQQHNHGQAKKQNTSYHLFVRWEVGYWVSFGSIFSEVPMPYANHLKFTSTQAPFQTPWDLGRWTNDLLFMRREEFEWKIPLSAIIRTSSPNCMMSHICKCRKAFHNHVEVNPISLITIPKLSSTSTELVFHLQWISGFHFLKQMVTNAFIPGGPSKGFTFALHQPWSGFLSLYIFLCTLLSQCSKLLPFNMLKVLEMFPFVSKLTTWNS